MIGAGIGGVSFGLALCGRGITGETFEQHRGADRDRRDGLGIDSFTMVHVAVAVEDRFGLVIPDEEWARSETVGDASAHL